MANAKLRGPNQVSLTARPDTKPPVLEDQGACPVYTISPQPAQWGQQVTLTAAITSTFGDSPTVHLVGLAPSTGSWPVTPVSVSANQIVLNLPASAPDPAAAAYGIRVDVAGLLGGLTNCAPVALVIQPTLPRPPINLGSLVPGLNLPIPQPGQVTEPPTMLALLDNDHPEWLFLMVPANSPLPQIVNQNGQNITAGLGTPVSPTVANLVGQTLTSITGIGGDSSGLSAALGEITAILGDPNARVIIVKGGTADDLHNYQFDSGFAWTGTAEDAMDKLIFIGPPGASASCFNDKHLSDSQGEFTVTIGNARFVRIDSLKTVQASSDPAAGTIAINRSPQGFTFPQGQISDFQDELSSLSLTSPGS